jgi:hypothetical protein
MPPCGIVVVVGCDVGMRIVSVWVVVVVVCVVAAVSAAQPLKTRIAPAAMLTAKREKIFIPASCVLG